MAQRMTIAAARESPTQGCFIFNQLSDSPATTTAYASPEEALKKLSDIHLSSNGDKATQKPGKKSIWVNLQGAAEEQNRQAVQYLFPNMQQSQLDALLSPDAMYDMVELQPVRGEYLVGAIACSPSNLQMHSVTPNHAVAQGSDEDDVVLCLFVCSEQCLLTMHATPFMGLAETLRWVESERGRVVDCVPASGDSFRASHASASLLMAKTGGYVLCTLISFTCESFLPEITSLLSEVENIDELVFLISPGQQDQSDLLRRVALLRRRIADCRIGLCLKEKLLEDLIIPSMRASFVAKESEIVHAYKEILRKVKKALDRLDYTRDMLNQANLNFVTGVSMRMSQASAGLDFRITILNQVAAVCLPINLLIAIGGMNTKIPFINEQWDTLGPFFGVIGVIVLWTAICFTPLIRMALQGTKPKAIAESG